MKPRLLDLFCGAGGASMGYYQAGFAVVGVDLVPQPHYPFEFHQADAMSYPLDGVCAIHASPPCQSYCALKTMKNKRKHPRLIKPLRKRLIEAGHPWIIENVHGAPLKNAVMLCGSHFNLFAQGYQIRRHRYFEVSFPLQVDMVCQHGPRTVGVYGCKARDIAREKRHYQKPKTTRGRPIGVVLPHSVAYEAMQIGWMNIREISQAIPPVYTKYIGRQLRQHLDCVNQKGY